MKFQILSVLVFSLLFYACGHTDCCGPMIPSLNSYQVDTISKTVIGSRTYSTDSSFTLVFSEAQGCNLCPEISVVFMKRPISNKPYLVEDLVSSPDQVSIRGMDRVNPALNFHTIYSETSATVVIEDGKLHIISMGVPIQFYNSARANGYLSLNLKEF